MASSETRFQNRWHGPCNFPIRVEIVGEGIRYLNNDPDSKTYGAVVWQCPGCGEPFLSPTWNDKCDFECVHWNLAEEPQEGSRQEERSV